MRTEQTETAKQRWNKRPISKRRRALALTVSALLMSGACAAAPSQAPMPDAGVVPAAPPPPAMPAPQPVMPEARALPSFVQLVESVKVAVVNVEVTSRVQGRALTPFEGPPGDEFWERFFGHNGPRPQTEPRERVKQGVGSGFIISPRGLVLTNNHVVEGAVAIRVKLDDGRSFEADILGRDPLTDVALIKLKDNPSNLPVAKLGDSDSLRVGEWVVAIGNPFGLASSVSAGIVSARARNIGAGPYDDFLQTDAAINPGNSGGPLFNMNGEVVGINTAIIGGGSGIGFAVPSNLAKAILPQLEKDGSVTRGWLGVTVQDVTPELAKGLGLPASSGALVAEVTKDSPAEKAGLKADDVIVAIDGDKVGSSGELTRKVALKNPGTVSTLTLYRGSKQENRKVTLGTRPDLEGLGLKGKSGGTGDARQEKLGLSLQDVSPELAAQRNLPPGALITEVKPGSVAHRADLRAGMVVVEVGGRAIRSAAELRRALADAKAGSVLLLRVHVGQGKLLRALTIPD